MGNLDVRGPEHRTSRLAIAGSRALHGAVVALLIGLGCQHVVPAKPEPEPPAGSSRARPPHPKDDDVYYQRIPGASRFAGQIISLQLSIDEHGQVRDVKVLQGVDPELDRKMVARALTFVYWPALDDAGVAIAVTLRSKFQIVKDEPFDSPGPR
jgi:hypothetical protein